MTTTATMIRKHVFSLESGRIFATRDMLMHGSRSAVDHATSRLVHKKVIIRLARGIFVRNDQQTEMPEIAEIAMAKAAAFGRDMYFDLLDAARLLCLVSGKSKENVFSTTSRSSKFDTIHGTVHLKGVSVRKVGLLGSTIGIVVAALWFMGKQRMNVEIRKKATIILTPKQEMQLRSSVAMMPDWMAKHFHWYGSDRWYGMPELFTRQSWNRTTVEDPEYISNNEIEVLHL